ncbi:acyl-CoA dehydrogenase family protein [Cupriavidus plantarum]|uniref:acyl-CoA dehydrogenase family protein n=1 Tax=Cupriavidus plantarum TaxID=942865 RepID=UPI001B0DC48E|nr:Crotonobetainyl-CoA reductase [Cupriavidus plantarum]SMR85246.1 acyl-CoA dehydrogenase [Cupriavidus plantarum]
MDNEYSDALESLLRDHCTPAVARAVEAGDAASGEVLWAVLRESGFADCLLPDAGLSLCDAGPMLVAMGRYAVPLPLGQTMFARAVLVAADVAVPDGPIALATVEGVEGGARAHVADGATAAWYLVQDGDRAALLSRDAVAMARTGAHADLGVTIGVESLPASFALPRGTLRSIGAAVHTALIAGAMARTFDLTLQYANDRAQFGRPIGKFQAVQHQIALQAEHVAATRMAAQLACQGEGWQPDAMRAAIGKCQASEAASTVAALAHAVHGAIGVTEEYDLQLFTRRLHAWRMAEGSERYWGRWIGGMALDGEAEVVEEIRRWSGESVAASDDPLGR